MQITSLQEEIEILGHQMANLSVGIVSRGSSQTTSNPNCEIQNYSLQDAINMQYYQNQPAAPLNVSGYASGNQAFNSQMNAELPPIYEWEDQNPFCESHPYTLDRLLEGADQEVFPYCSWLDTGN